MSHRKFNGYGLPDTVGAELSHRIFNRPSRNGYALAQVYKIFFTHRGVRTGTDVRMYEKERNENMVMECNNPDKIEQKCPDDMSFKEIVAELKTMATPESRLEWLILNLDFLFDYREEEIESLRGELRCANAELTLLKQAKTDPAKPFFEIYNGRVNNPTTILSDVRIKAYCEGIADAANQIRYFVESCTEDEDDDS